MVEEIGFLPTRWEVWMDSLAPTFGPNPAEL